MSPRRSHGTLCDLWVQGRNHQPGLSSYPSVDNWCALHSTRFDKLFRALVFHLVMPAVVVHSRVSVSDQTSCAFFESIDMHIAFLTLKVLRNHAANSTLCVRFPSSMLFECSVINHVEGSCKIVIASHET